MRLPKLQLHLSTCIVLMFAAGGILWANTVPYSAALVQIHNSDGTTTLIYPAAYGDPFRILRCGTNDYQSLEYTGIAGNLFVGLLLLSGLAWICEYFLRRRARSQEPGANS